MPLDDKGWKNSSKPNDYVISYLETKADIEQEEGCTACAAGKTYYLVKPSKTQLLTHAERGRIAACTDLEAQGHTCKKWG